MRRDLIIGMIVSLTLHAGVIEYSAWAANRPSAPPPNRPMAAVELITMPKIEPDKPDVDDAVYEDRQQKMEQVFAPPVLEETFQLVLDTSFVQPIPPPVPGVTAINRMTITIPATPPSTGRRLDGIVEIYELAKVDEIPEVVVQVPPDYPYQLKSAGITGNVLVDCIVDINGDVRGAFAGNASQHDFAVSAVRAVSQWKFRPGQRKGKAVNTHVRVPVVFSITRSPFSNSH
ncbi:MAG: energy transducer TonB [Opitutaceae bacterium]